jgi:type 1 glutamine amidotransferase
MTWLARICTVLAIAALMSSATRAEDKPVRALFVLCGSGGHNIEVNAPPLLKTIDTLGGIKVTLLSPPKGKPGDGEHLAKLADVKRADYDVLVFNTVFGKLDPAAEKAVQTFVEDGGGLVGIHGVTASFGNSKVWFNLMGGRFAGHAAGTHDMLIDIVDPKHPITDGVMPFTVNDEEYTYRFADVKRNVIGKFRERPAKTVEKNGNNDILWTIEAGKGRVFHSGLGHDVKAWSNPSFQKVIIQGIYWSAGTPKSVTIPAASKP